MAKVTHINHVAIAVPELEGAMDFWRDTLGLVLDHIEDVPSQNSIVAFFPTGDSEVELVKPNQEDSGLGRFLKEKGPGIHHLCLEVDDLEGMLIILKSKGIRLINEAPVQLPGRKIAFIHPKASGGVLVELLQRIELDDGVISPDT
jgi:methylmalonyl-CoA/ethylmalonyl-CoA epimerase